MEVKEERSEWFTVAECEARTPLSRTEIFELMRRGDLVPRYPTARPLLRLSDIDAYIASSPTESPRRRRR